MKTKTIVTTVLLLFIFASVVYLVVGEVRSTIQSAPAQTNPPAVMDNPEPASQIQTLKVVVYYFRGTARCPRCIKFESFSDEAVRQAFPDALKDGRLEWKVVNVEEPGNEHFVKDYQLYTKSIVVVKMEDGKQTKWKNLTRIWKLVSDKTAFMQYIQTEVSEYLGAD